MRKHSIRTAALCLVAVAAMGFGARAGQPTSPPPPKCAMASCYDPLFTVQYPHYGSFTTSRNVRFPLPVDYYDGSGLILVGVADLAAERDLTAGTGYRPVQTESGGGIGVLAVAAYTDTDLGPYNETAFAFPVHVGEAAPVADDPGALVAAALSPHNELWFVRLILDQQLPIDAGREYLGFPKEPDPKRLVHDIRSSRVVFTDSEPDGTTIMSGDVTLHAIGTPSSAVDLALQAETQSVAADVAQRSGLRLRGVLPDPLHPGALGYAMAIIRTADPAGLRVAPFGGDSIIRVNPATSFGSRLAALQLEPKVSVILTGIRMVLDGSL